MPLKILFINKNLSLGGGERLITNLANYSLRKNAATVDFAIYENRVDLKNIESLSIFKLTPFANISNIEKILLLPLVIIKLLRLASRYDCVMSFERYPAYLNFIVSFFLKKRSIIYIINPLAESFNLIYKNKPLKNVHFFLHKILLNQAHLILTMSSAIKREVFNKYSIKYEKIQVLYPGIDIDSIDQLVKEPIDQLEKKLFINKKVIINIGRLHKQKNQATLIESFHAASKRISNLRLLIIGEGPEKKHLEVLIKSLHLQKRVFLLGGKKNPFKYLVKSHVFVLSSHFEGIPSVVLEAMYCKLPVISVDSSFGLREILAPNLKNDENIHQTYVSEYGTIIPNSNQTLVSDLTKGILLLAYDNQLKTRIKMNAFRWSQSFAINEVGKNWNKIIGKIRVKNNLP